jgi:hypothetical protein
MLDDTNSHFGDNAINSNINDNLLEEDTQVK